MNNNEIQFTDSEENSISLNGENVDWSLLLKSKPSTVNGQSVWVGYCDLEVLRQDGSGVNLVEDASISFVSKTGIEVLARLRTLPEMLNALVQEGVPVMMIQFKRVEEKYTLKEDTKEDCV